MGEIPKKRIERLLVGYRKHLHAFIVARGEVLTDRVPKLLLRAFFLLRERHIKYSGAVNLNLNLQQWLKIWAGVQLQGNIAYTEHLVLIIADIAIDFFFCFMRESLASS